MTFAGSDGDTRGEMAKVLRFPRDDSELHASFAALQRSLDTALAKSEEHAKESKKFGGPSEPITLQVANRLFGQKGYEYRPPFLELIKDRYGAPLEQLDFVKNAPQAHRPALGPQAVVNPPLAAGEIVTTGTLTCAFPVSAGEFRCVHSSQIPFPIRSPA
jgi:hypothetical protein